MEDFEEISEAEAARMEGARHDIGGNRPPEPIDTAALLERFRGDHAAFMAAHAEVLPLLTEQMRARFAELQATASAWLTQCPKITTQTQADDCAGFGKQLAALSKEADELRKAVKSIHDQAGAEVQAAFKGLIDGAERCLVQLRPKLGEWLSAEKERQRLEREAAELEAAEAKRKADAAAEEAHRKLEAANRGDFQGVSVNVMAEVNRAGELEREADAAAERARMAGEAKAHAGAQYATGGVKRAAHLGSRKVIRCADPKAACAWLAKKKLEVPFPAEVTEAIEKAARRLMKTFPALVIPGVEQVEEEKARF